MMDHEERDGLGASESGILCCVTAIRLGGGLDAIADRFGLENDFNLIDRGVRAALLKHRGGEFRPEVVSEGLAAGWMLGTILSDKGECAAFSSKVIQVADYAIMTAKSGDGRALVKTALKTAMDAANLWPWPIRIKSTPSMAELESKCQEGDLRLALSGEISSLLARSVTDSQRFKSIVDLGFYSGEKS